MNDHANDAGNALIVSAKNRIQSFGVGDFHLARVGHASSVHILRTYEAKFCGSGCDEKRLRTARAVSASTDKLSLAGFDLGARNAACSRAASDVRRRPAVPSACRNNEATPDSRTRPPRAPPSRAGIRETRGPLRLEPATRPPAGGDRP